jgi:hypothetical protein
MVMLSIVLDDGRLSGRLRGEGNRGELGQRLPVRALLLPLKISCWPAEYGIRAEWVESTGLAEVKETGLYVHEGGKVGSVQEMDFVAS